MQSARLCILLVVALMLCASTLGASSRERHTAQRGVSASHGRILECDLASSRASYANPDVDMHASQIEALLAAATNDMPSVASLWSQSNLINACRTPNSPSGILSCTDDGFPTTISVTVATASPDATHEDRPSAYLGNLTELTSLRLSFGAFFTGTLPSSWSNLTHLTTIFFSSQVKLTGSIPIEWSQMPALNSLTLPFQFSIDNVVPVPHWIASMSYVYIRGLNFGSNMDIPDAWFTSDTLTTLNLETMFWSGNLPNVVTSNTKLVVLRLDGYAEDNVVGLPGQATPFPSDLSGMTALETFILENHGTSSAFPTAWPPNLQFLTMYNVPNMGGIIPQSLVDTPSFLDLTLATMPALGGALPGPSSPGLSRLEYLSLVGLGLTGPISSGWFFIPSLAVMNIASMTTTMQPFELGPLPAVNSGLCKIRRLNLASIQLSGTLPAALLSICPEIDDFDVSDNNLVGSIPSDWSKSNGLRVFYLYRNRFTGAIPTNTKWKQDSNELRFDVYGNSLTGTLPTSLLSQNWKQFDIENNEINVCANIAQLPSNSNDCYFAQLSNSNWCPCSDSWKNAGCDTDRDCATPSEGPSPLAALPPYTTGTLPPAFPVVPSAGPSSSPSSPSSTPSPSPTSPGTPITPNYPSSNPSGAVTPDVPTGAASSSTLAFASIIASVASAALMAL